MLIHTFKITLIVFFTCAAFGQELSSLKLINKPKKLDSEIVAAKDRNGRFCAMIQVVADMEGFKYSAYNGVVKMEDLPGQDNVFVSPDERVLEIYKTGYKPLKATRPKAAPVEKQITLKRNDRLTVDLYPQVPTGAIQVAVTPFDAKIELKGGAFKMGSNDYDNEKPVHSVTVNSFYMSKYEVTQKEWREVMGSAPSRFKGDSRPVERVSWFDAVEFCNKKSLRAGLTPAYKISGKNVTRDFSVNGYRLPTEVEWEFAARGGKQSRGYKSRGSNKAEKVGWYGNNSGGKTHPVGRKQANELGLYDMSGNVWEWCSDWYDSDYYKKSSKNNPQGPSSGSRRVLRGGSWYSVTYILIF